MNSMKSLVIIAVVGLLVVAAFVLRASRTEEPRTVSAGESLPASDVPVFIELGSDRCTSCRAMIPVLEELRNEHDCNLEVRFIDVWDDPDEGDRYGVRAIPTQVLLAPDGRELTRHTGFWSADSIRAAFAENGYTLADSENCKL